MMKKLLSFLLCAIMLCTTGYLFACNNDNSTDNGPRTELRVLSFRPEDKDFYEGWFIKEFEKENPDIKVLYD